MSPRTTMRQGERDEEDERKRRRTSKMPKGGNVRERGAKRKQIIKVSSLVESGQAGKVTRAFVTRGRTKTSRLIFRRVNYDERHTNLKKMACFHIPGKGVTLRRELGKNLSALGCRFLLSSPNPLKLHGFSLFSSVAFTLCHVSPALRALSFVFHSDSSRSFARRPLYPIPPL